MNNIGLFQVIYIKYQTKTNKKRIKKEFIFLDSFNYNNSIECLELYKLLSNRYKQYNNIISLEYNTIHEGYIFNNSRYTTLLLKPIKGETQKGVKIHITLKSDVF